MRIIMGKACYSVRHKRAVKRRYTNILYEYFVLVPIGVSLFVCAALLLMRPIFVSGHSMQPTLWDGDLMVASDLFYTPARGDIVVLNKESFFDGSPIVKRVIAVEGDSIDIDFQSGEVHLNGELLNEPYIAEPTYTEEGTVFPQTVPEGCIFVMGDNRNHSDDSRTPELGMVDTRCVIGKVYAVIPIGKLYESIKEQ